MLQAILGKMSGIRPSNESGEWSDTTSRSIFEIVNECSQLFVRSKKASVTNDIIACNSYDCIYVDKKNAVNVNQLVVTEKLADLDSTTKNVADLTVDFESLPSTDSGEDDWDSDEVTDNIFDAASYLYPTEDSGRHQLLDLNSDESEKECDIDIQFTEEQLKEWVSS